MQEPVKQRIYIETSVVSYLAAGPTRDLIRAARQELTCEWWGSCHRSFAPHVSHVVLREISTGDPAAAARRLAIVAGLPVLTMDSATEDLAAAIADARVLPASALDDILHLAVATVHGMDFLVTWNCRHLANAQLMGRLSDRIEEEGFVPPVICTPEGLSGGDGHV